jgi:hypothetical protein
MSCEFRLAIEHHRFMPAHPEGDDDRHIDVLMESRASFPAASGLCMPLRARALR